MIPKHVFEALIRYRDEGLKPGQFLVACLRGDLFGAAHSADSASSKKLAEIAQWIVKEIPESMRGSKTAVTRHVHNTTKTLSGERLSSVDNEIVAKIYSAYPRRDAPIPDETSIRKACLRRDIPECENDVKLQGQLLLSIVKAYAKQRRALPREDWRYTPMCSTYMNQSRYLSTLREMQEAHGETGW